MREIRLSGSEGGGDELNRLSLPLSLVPALRLFSEQSTQPRNSSKGPLSDYFLFRAHPMRSAAISAATTREGLTVPAS
jgi:hypothetical protein